jgi:hypothetical protein
MRSMSLLQTQAMIALLAVAMLGAAGPASAEDKALPRTFQKAHLGMSINELVQIYPQLAKTKPDVRVRQSVVMPSSDSRILRQEYKFHQGALYELQIYYDVKRLPRGHAGLLARLKEVYGTPPVEGIEEFDLTLGILSGHRTVWNDGVTRVTLAERERISENGQFIECVLVLTDLTLERRYQQAVEEHRRHQELEIPIPLPDGHPDRTASTPLNGKLPS